MPTQQVLHDNNAQLLRVSRLGIAIANVVHSQDLGQHKRSLKIKEIRMSVVNAPRMPLVASF